MTIVVCATSMKYNFKNTLFTGILTHEILHIYFIGLLAMKCKIVDKEERMLSFFPSGILKFECLI